MNDNKYTCTHFTCMCNHGLWHKLTSTKRVYTPITYTHETCEYNHALVALIHGLYVHNHVETTIFQTRYDMEKIESIKII